MILNDIQMSIVFNSFLFLKNEMLMIWEPVLEESVWKQYLSYLKANLKIMHGGTQV